MDAAAAPKKSGPLRWILLGCGALGLLGVLGASGCAGVFYLIYRGTDGVAEVGAEYLRTAPGLVLTVGDSTVKRKWLGWNVQVVNDGGHARIEYTMEGPRAGLPANAVVWLARSGGKWSAVGARVRMKEGTEYTAGNPPSPHGSDWD